MGLQSDGCPQSWGSFIEKHSDIILSYPRRTFEVSDLSPEQRDIWRKMNNWGMLEDHGIKNNHYSGPRVWSVQERVFGFAEELNE